MQTKLTNPLSWKPHTTGSDELCNTARCQCKLFWLTKQSRKQPNYIKTRQFHAFHLFHSYIRQIISYCTSNYSNSNLNCITQKQHNITKYSKYTVYIRHWRPFLFVFMRRFSCRNSGLTHFWWGSLWKVNVLSNHPDGRT